MRRTDLKDLADTIPFRPFTLETSGGTAIDVLRAEDILLPARRADIVIVFSESGSMAILDTEHITGLVAQ